MWGSRLDESAIAIPNFSCRVLRNATIWVAWHQFLGTGTGDIEIPSKQEHHTTHVYGHIASTCNRAHPPIALNSLTFVHLWPTTPMMALPHHCCTAPWRFPSLPGIAHSHCLVARGGLDLNRPYYPYQKQASTHFSHCVVFRSSPGFFFFFFLTSLFLFSSSCLAEVAVAMS